MVFRNIFVQVGSHQFANSFSYRMNIYPSEGAVVHALEAFRELRQ
jgi:hypothetical protein